MIYTSAMKGGGQILGGETLMKQKQHLCCCVSFLRSCSFWRRTITTESSIKSSSSGAVPDKTLPPPPPPPPCKQQQKVVPWLMLSKEDIHEKSRSFFSLDEKQVHKIKFTNAANRSWCSGSSDGWLVMSHKTQGNFLYNPITQQQINLPPHEIISYTRQKEEKLDQRLRDLYERNRMYFLDKAIVVSSVPTITNSSSSLSSSSSSSSSSDHDNTVVAVIYARSCKDGFSGIGFCRPGDKEWYNVPFHKYYCDGHGGEEKNMVPIQVNPEVASVEGEDGEDNNNGDQKEEEEEEEEDEEEPERKEVAVEEEEEEEEEEDEDEDESDDDDYEAYRKYASDIIFYKGAFYVVTDRSTKLGIIHISSGNNKLNAKVRWPNIEPLKLKKSEKFILNNNYLVESCGELLMVIRIRKDTTRSKKALGVLKTKKFLVFKLDETGDTLKWVRAESLGDQILFLGCNYSKAVSVSDMPPGYRGNCIYFTDDTRFLYMQGYSGRVCFRDIGVFFLEDEKIDPIFPKDDYLSYYRKYCSHRKYTPTFITPNPYPSSSSSHMGALVID